MRAIFTDRDRRLLKRWLEKDKETGETRKLFTWIRLNTPQLLSDLKLMNRVIKELKKMRRGGGREGRSKQRVQLNITARLTGETRCYCSSNKAFQGEAHAKADIHGG